MSRRGTQGYILVETMVALVLLSIGAFAVQGTIRESLLTRGQAQDYTRARFLLQDLIADIELQPLLAAGKHTGQFKGADDRFRWDTEVRRVDVPKLKGGQKPFRFPEGFEYLTRVRATIYWKRGGREFSETMETLLSPEHLFQR